MQQPAGFFQSLFDFSFTVFVTSKIIRLLYALSIVGAALVSLSWIVGSFMASPAFGVLVLLVGAPLFFLISIIYARVLLEIIIVIFRISENIAEIAAGGRGGQPAEPPMR
ncbi:MAG: DUF4282 domain-containing protein [Candidatus Rokuibacteriota bacterium]